MTKVLSSILLTICVISVIAGSAIIAYSPHITYATSTADEATRDEAITDKATIDQITPTKTVQPTTTETEAPTIQPTGPETNPEVSPEIEVAESKEEYTDKPDDEATDKYIDSAKEQQELPVYSDSELDLLARVICAEAGGCSEYCQWLVASATMNLAEDLGDGSLSSIVYDTDIVYISYDIPDSQCYKVAERVLSGDRDYQVMAFRNDHYHDFGTPYVSVDEDNVYFSTY